VLNQQHRLVTISQHQQQQLHQQQHPGFSKLQTVKDYANAAGGGGGGGAAGSGGGSGTGAPENNDMLKILEPIIVMKTK